MRTLVLDRPGSLTLTDTHPPEDPGPGMALVRVLRVGVCGTDIHAWHGRQPFFTYPRILGHELAVEVLATGPGVANVREGDRCAVEPYLNCGVCRPCRLGRGNCCERMQVLGVHLDGGLRERIAVPARKLHPSSRIDAESLALVEMLSVGAHAVARARPSADDTVLVIGAGPIGLGVAAFAVQSGASVTIGDVNPSRLAFCRERAGFQSVIDLSGDPANAVHAAYGGELPSIVFDATGNAASMQAAFRLVANAGTLVFVGLVLGDLSFEDRDFHRRETTLLASRNALPEDFRQVMAALESGRIDVRPWITHRARLEDGVEAFASWTRPDSGVLKAMILVSG
ncbi:MAG TPA: zinc-binding alcohol dehydrogenase family protein [Vicinamibacterales bacterium]|nr:zinc-binding alcohol dehydrogenase family protein [Vicinamibacterales bacterium]